MEILLLIFGIVTFNIAWRARGEARHARKLIADLQEELSTLRMELPVAPAGRSAYAAETPASAGQGLAARASPPSRPEDALPPQPMRPFEPVMADRPPPLTPANEFELVEADWLLPDSPGAVTPQPQPQPAPNTQPKTQPQLQPHAQQERRPLPKLQVDAAPETTEAPPPRAPQPPPQWLLAAKAWLFGGNLVAKLGLLILFIGVSFLLKYTAARVTVPIEFRLAGIVLADLAVLAWAWRIRLRRPSISLPVQGAAVAVLMLVTFGAFRLYQLIPSSLAFALLLVLTVFTCLLAVLQNAMWLAIFGIAGGFAAPILASSGGGSHIGLFSYYALLNAGVLGLALRRSWRPLNLLGFAFTFSIATAWGAQRYVPENYLSVQLFLLLFFVFYVSIPLAYAHQQSVKLKNYVDGTLVFGTPMLGFGLQFTIVRGFEFGVAYSALALGLFYIALATVLRRRDKFALLGDAFLALGIVFGTLAIPFALDGRWTSAAWALEGAGIVWIGLRQKQKLAWIFGLLVQLGAWISFVGTASGLSSERAADSNLWLGFILLALTGFMMATRFRAQERTRNFNLLAGVFLTVATVWLVAGAWTEIFLRAGEHRQGALLVASAMLAAAGLYAIARKMAWPLAAAIALAVQIIAGATLLAVSLGSWLDQLDRHNLFDRPLLGSLMICAGALFSSWALMRQNAARGTHVFTMYRLMLVWAAVWWFCIAAPDLALWLEPTYNAMVPGDTGSQLGRALATYALLLVATATFATALARGLRWPALRWLSVPVWPALALTTLITLALLYNESDLPSTNSWLSFGALWLGGEWLLVTWSRRNWRIAPGWLRAAHTVRSAGPWLMIWPVASSWIAGWITGSDGYAYVSDWSTDASWARFIPSWLMMAAAGWMMQRVRANGWPVRPIADWYRQCLIPLACTWLALLVAAWNVTQDGGMSPLPYLPLLNPLDLSTCFAILLVIACWRLQTPAAKPAAANATAATPGAWPAGWIAPAPLAIALFGYAWFNLALLRTVSHYLDVPYTFDSMFASQFVQAMLSLVWSITALLLMRHAATRATRSVWMGGAVLLALVVGKLFLVDLSNIGGVERIVSFLGVGALMVSIGYLAPFPTQTEKPAETA